jgi:hypothetical protein
MISPVGLSIAHLGGYAPALPTPFDDNEKIDLAAFERMCQLQIRAGATALVVGGTTGEAPTLSHTEHAELVSVAADVASGRVPVIAGTGSNSTAHAIELTEDAEAAGADAALCVVPYYNKPTQAGIYAHVCAISQSTSVPIILYDVPSRTVCRLEDETIARLVAEMPQIVGLKFRPPSDRGSRARQTSRRPAQKLKASIFCDNMQHAAQILTLSWPRQLPIEGEPRHINELVNEYSQWMSENEIPKLFVSADPGAIPTGPVREFCRGWKNQTEATVKEIHFIQEDSGPEIGSSVAAWIRRNHSDRRVEEGAPRKT